MNEITVLNHAITGAASTIEVPFNTYNTSIGFQFIYSGLNADVTLMPQISLNGGANYDDFEVGQIVLQAGSTSEGITIEDLRNNYTIRWRVLASSATAGTITSVVVSK